MSLARATLTPLDRGAPDSARALTLDFNPATIMMELVGGGTSGSGPGRPGALIRPARRKLSFEAVFDTTRPADASSGGAGASAELSAGLDLGLYASASVGVSASASVGVSASVSAGISAGVKGGGYETHDVRRKTRQILDILAEDPQLSSVRRHVQLSWGAITFTGALTTGSEELTWFSEDGVPLRAKMRLTLEEADEQQAIDAVARREASVSLGVGVGISLSASASLGLGASLGVGLEAGIGLDIGLSAGISADLSLDASLSAEVFGSAAVAAGAGGAPGVGAAAGASAASGPAGAPGGAAQLPGSQGGPGASPGAAVSAKRPSKAGPSSRSPAPPGPRAPWAPDGPAPGSRAAAVAALVLEARESGQERAPSTPGSLPAAPPPVQGSPPRRARLASGVGDAPIFKGVTSVTDTSRRPGQPRWEALDPDPER